MKQTRRSIAYSFRFIFKYFVSIYKRITNPFHRHGKVIFTCPLMSHLTYHFVCKCRTEIQLTEYKHRFTTSALSCLINNKYKTTPIETLREDDINYELYYFQLAFIFYVLPVVKWDINISSSDHLSYDLNWPVHLKYDKHLNNLNIYTFEIYCT